MEGVAIGAMRDAAVAATHLDDFGDEWFMGPLAAWAADLEQPNLTEFGRKFLRSLAVRDLARRLRVLDVTTNIPRSLRSRSLGSFTSRGSNAAEPR